MIFYTAGNYNFNYICRDIQPKENTSYSAKFVLDEKADYEFTLHSSNVEGLSKEGSVISVPKRGIYHFVIVTF